MSLCESPPTPSFKGLVSFSLERLRQSTVPFISGWRNFHTIYHFVFFKLLLKFYLFFHVCVCVHAVCTHMCQRTHCGDQKTTYKGQFFTSKWRVEIELKLSQWQQAPSVTGSPWRGPNLPLENLTEEDKTKPHFPFPVTGVLFRPITFVNP